MKFSCERDVLAEALSTAGRAVANRGGSLPVLSGVRIQLTDNTLAVTGATPGETVRFIFGTTPGSTAIPGCPGQTVDIINPKVAGSAVAGESGNASVSQTVGAGAAGKTVRLVAVQIEGCLASNLVVHTFP